MAKVKTQLVIEGKNNSKQAFDQVNSQIDGMNKKLSLAGKALATAFSVSQLTGAVRRIATAADNYGLMTARLRLATEGQEEFNTAQTELRRIAAATEAPLSSLITLYGRISRPLKEVGRTQSDILRLTEAVATSFRVSGASAQEAENGVIQFAQALGAGALRGDEFNSVAEQAPRLMQALADGIGVPISALKDMAKQGQLTAQVVTDALISQLDTLRSEADTLPQTVGGAMTQLAERWNEAIGQADMQPLIDAINALGDTLSDPVVIENLIALASALTRLAAAGVEASSDIVDLGRTIARTAAKSQGLLDELDAIDDEIKAIDKSLDGTWSPGDLLVDMFFSDEELRAKRDALVALRAAIVEERTGMNAEMQELARQAADAARAERDKELADYAGYVGKLKELQSQVVKSIEKSGKDLVAAEKRAQGDLKKVWEERLKIQQRYQKAISELGGAGTGEASYGAAQALKVSAREALSRRDLDTAKAQAQAALEMLQELARAGESTYGFEGFIRELEAIELQANAIEEQAIKDKITGIQVSMADLAKQAKELQEMPISVKADEASIAAARTAIQQLALQLGKELVIPVSVAKPGAAPDAPGFASGGMIRGPGTGTSDSVLARLSNGEFVMRAAAVKHYGPRLLELMNGMKLPRFADGGLVEAAVSAQPSAGRDLGRVELSIGGENFSLLADAPNFDRVLRRAALKRGRTRIN